jgi:RNA polymerase sigma-70 factor, ECF subfamily
MESHATVAADKMSATNARTTPAQDRATLFRRLSHEYLDASYRLARAILGDPAAAEDAVHDAFVTAWRKWDTLRDASRFEAWFHRILVNTCRNQLKRSSRIRVTDISSASHPAIDDPHIADSPERQAIGQAMRDLGEDHRVVLALRYYRDLTVDDIAALLGIRPGTVKSRLHHAQKKLRVALEQQQRKGTL